MRSQRRIVSLVCERAAVTSASASIRTDSVGPPHGSLRPHQIGRGRTEVDRLTRGDTLEQLSGGWVHDLTLYGSRFLL